MTKWNVKNPPAGVVAEQPRCLTFVIRYTEEQSAERKI